MYLSKLLLVTTLLGSVVTSNPIGSSDGSVIHSLRSNSCLQKDVFVLKGQIAGQHEGILQLQYENKDGKMIIDTSLIVNGAFEFKGTISEPVKAMIFGKNKPMSINDPNVSFLFLEPGHMDLRLEAGAFANLKLSGSKTHEEMAALDRKIKPLMEGIKPILAEYNKANEVYIQAMNEKRPQAELDQLKERASSIQDKVQPIGIKVNEIEMEYIRTHPASYLSASLFSSKISSMSPVKSQAVYDSFSPEIKRSKYGKEALKAIQKMQNGSPGSKAFVFAAQDINGQQLSLTDFKGKKFVLLDFWASWCGPCRKGNPHLLSLYGKYKDKGFEIIGISDDDSNPLAWKKAVEQDKIGVWKHVLRGLKRTSAGSDKSGDISERYGIHTLPTKILIDKNGMIVGRYGGGGESDEAMDKKLAEIFN